MGSIISYLWWGGHDPDEINSETGLSRRDIQNVRNSWKKINADGVGSGCEILIRYFKAHPEYKKNFRTFKDIPVDDLKSNIQFNAHALGIISSLNAIIENLEKPSLAATLCRKIGSNHNARRITQQQFDDLKAIIVKLFTDLHFSESTMKSWVRAVTFMYSNIYEEITPKPNN